MEFDLETILTTSKYAAIVVPLLVLAAFSLAVYRAGSTFPILSSLWQLTAGKRVIADETIARYVQAQHDLASFKFFSHIQTASVDEAARLITWAEHHQIPIRKLKSCGRHFNIERLSVDASSLPTPALKASWLTLSAIALVFATASISAILFMQNTYMSFKDDGQRFVITDAGIRTLEGRFQTWNKSEGVLNETVCNRLAPQTPAPGMLLSAKQTQLLCEALGTPELERTQEGGLRSQKLAAALLAGLLYCGFWACCARMSRAQIAERLMKQLAESAHPTPPPGKGIDEHAPPDQHETGATDSGAPLHS